MTVWKDRFGSEGISKEDRDTYMIPGGCHRPRGGTSRYVFAVRSPLTGALWDDFYIEQGVVTTKLE